MNGKMKKILIGMCVLQGVLLCLSLVLLLQLWGKKAPEQEMVMPAALEAEQVEIYLPETYYVAAGLTMEIYNSQITNLGTAISGYEVVWECDRGESLERKFHIESTEEMLGEYALKVRVLSPTGNLLAEKESVLSIVEGTEETFSILALGDSLSSDASLYWKLQEHLEGNLICSGTKACEGFLTEARYGFSAEDYLNETPYTLTDAKEDCHPFWNPQTKRFDWNYYKSTTGVSPDAVWVFLGTNRLYAGKQNVADIVEIVKLIRQDDKNLPIYVVNTVYSGGQNGLGSWKNKYGDLMLPGESKMSRDRATFALMTDLWEELKEEKQVYLVPAAISMDSASVYAMEERPASPYVDVTEAYETDPLHPTKDGYYQIADTIYSTISGTIGDWKK